jgi:pilus assembly protein CpaB
MKKNLGPLLGIALVVAILSTGLFYGLFAGRLREAGKAAARASMVVAARKLHRGTVLKAADLKLAPAAVLPPGSFSAAGQVEGLTLLEDLQAERPVTAAHVASPDGAVGAGVPTGLRAVSVHVYDSSGVLGLLRPGNKVDVQVVGARAPNEAGVRTVLQNLQVLAVNPQAEQGQGRPPAPVVTLLASPAEADLLALGEAAARIRLLLRNPLDTDRNPAEPVFTAALLRGRLPGAPAVLARNRSKTEPASSSAAPAGTARLEPALPVLLSVRIAGVSAAALDELGGRRPAQGSGSQLHVSPLQPDLDLAATLERLEQKRQFEVLSSSQLEAAAGRDTAVHAGASGKPAGSCALRIQFQALANRAKGIRLRVQPEITSGHPEGVTTRRIETELDLKEGQSFLVAGLSGPDASPDLLSRLFPGRREHADGRELVVLVTPVRKAAIHTASVKTQP